MMRVATQLARYQSLDSSHAENRERTAAAAPTVLLCAEFLGVIYPSSVVVT